ncbi:MAG: M48 family metallopeptidase [Flavobacteriales bacterium]
MTPKTLFYIIIGILLVNFIIDKILDYLNAKHFNDTIPKLLQDVYEEKEYKKSQAYKKQNYKFGLISSFITIVVTLLFFFLEGFKYVDDFARSISNNSIVITLIFFGLIMFASDLLNTPFSYYHTFVIEEKFGFNKTTPKIFFLDKIKGLLMMIVIGGLLLSALVWFYERLGNHFWLFAWALFTIFMFFINMFYAKLIVPLFNKQTPLEQGSLRTKIENYAKKVGFKANKIFVIDGSKRSTKANAYFSGFGNEKRITLYDTLINDLEEDEIVAVLAHEVGHYKRKHIIINLIISIASTGFTLWLLSLFISNPLFAESLKVSQPSFHVGLIVFGVLYSPISEITGLIMNYLSRKFEYQADNYAKTTYGAKPLITALKKLTKNSLSNLTPHPAYVILHYSHPTLLQRVQNLLK